MKIDENTLAALVILLLVEVEDFGVEGREAHPRLSDLQVHEAARVLGADLAELGNGGEEAGEELVVVGVVVLDLQLQGLQEVELDLADQLPVLEAWTVWIRIKGETNHEKLLKDKICVGRTGPTDLADQLPVLESRSV